MTSGKVWYMKVFCLWIIYLYTLYRYVFVHTVFFFYFIKLSVFLLYKKCGKLPVENMKECEINRAYPFYGAISLSQILPGGTIKSIKNICWILSASAPRTQFVACSILSSNSDYPTVMFGDKSNMYELLFPCSPRLFWCQVTSTVGAGMCDKIRTGRAVWGCLRLPSVCSAASPCPQRIRQTYHCCSNSTPKVNPVPLFYYNTESYLGHQQPTQDKGRRRQKRATFFLQSGLEIPVPKVLKCR